MKTGVDCAKKAATKIEGWLKDSEGELLYNLARNCTGRGVIVEIGSWKGRSTVWLGLGSKSGRKTNVYAIDNHVHTGKYAGIPKSETLKEFRKNMKTAKIDKIVTHIVKSSADAAAKFNKPIELLFVDGNHKYDNVKNDFNMWFPKIIDGGTIAFHDATTKFGPKKVVEKFICKSSHFKNCSSVHSTVFAEKTKRISEFDSLKNGIFIISLNLNFLFNRVKRIFAG